MSLLKKIGLGLLSLGLSSSVLASDEKKLYVNTNPVHYSMEKSRDSGEKDLLKMTLNEKLEEGWFYVKYKDNKEIWKDCADNQTIASAILDFDEIHKVINKNLEEFSFYHFHPVFFEEDKNVKENEKLDYSQIPSNEDFVACLSLNNKIINFYPEHMMKIDCKLVVSTGVYTFKIHPGVIILEKRKKEFDDSLAKIAQQMFLAEIGINKEFDYVMSNKDKFIEMNKNFAKKFSTEVLKIDFEEK